MKKDRFKFRAWNKETNTMHYDAEYTYDCMDGKPIIYKSSFGDVLDDENYIVEQCTGLKDKNGKLVFEGDIIGGLFGSYVKWCDHCKSFELFFDNECASCNCDIYWYEIVEDDGKYEVIGNVHQNTEFLK